MKTIYVIILFLVFFNVINIMFVAMEIFPESLAATDAAGINNTTTGEAWFRERTNRDYTDLLGLLFGSATSILAFAVTLSISIAAAWLTRSPAPFVVGMIAGIFITLYQSTSTIFEGYPFNSYIMLACSIGMVIMFVITSAEYLTHGDA